MKYLKIDKSGLRLSDLTPVLEDERILLTLSPRVRQNITKSRQVIEEVLASGESNQAVYGVNTGFGKLSSVKISPDKQRRLQENVIRCTALALGEPLPAPLARLVLLLRINTLTRGFSGVRPKLVDMLAALFNKGVIPVIPEKGSVGASGDLAPLGHLALVVLGEGEVFYRGKRMPAKVGLKRANIKPVELSAKEGLALVNGTQVMTALLVDGTLRLQNLGKLADLSGAMSLEALRGTQSSFDHRLQQVRPHPGQEKSAHNFRRLLKGSQILSSHKTCARVQDAYSLRCIPQVHGASRDGLDYITSVLKREINAVTDNPLTFADQKEVISGGNFHGHPIALAGDFLGIITAGLTNISERRIEHLVNADLSGLPAFLVKESGLNSGLMMAQMVAASLASENKVWAHPASVDTIPTSANKEDFVSMGTTAARKARMIIENLEYVIAIEFLCAAQALEFLKPLRPGRGVLRAYQTIRERVKPLETDRFIKPDVEAIREMMKTGRLLKQVEKEIGRLL